jgi:hypothetical protein
MGDEKVYHYKDGKIVGHSDKDDPYSSGKTYHYDADGKIIGHSDHEEETEGSALEPWQSLLFKTKKGLNFCGKYSLYHIHPNCRNIPNNQVKYLY